MAPTLLINRASPALFSSPVPRRAGPDRPPPIGWTISLRLNAVALRDHRSSQVRHPSMAPETYGKNRTLRNARTINSFLTDACTWIFNEREPRGLSKLLSSPWTRQLILILLNSISCVASEAPTDASRTVLTTSYPARRHPACIPACWYNFFGYARFSLHLIWSS